MTNAILIAAMVTFVIFVTIENLKRDFLIRNIKIINHRLGQFISNHLGEEKDFDIFMVKHLRHRIQEEFAKTEGLEALELSMIDSNTLKIVYQLDGEVETLKVTTEKGKIRIKEMNILEGDYI
ncbi:MAG: hypothetical protein AB2421_10780 [Thermotaleaceae bacterium]